MNNNNRGNNRRRGRGNNNRPQGGGQQLNRIDSRARGNAPQLLEKFKKLAHDAHLNGDRVTSEYYLQFADHYFRVIADARSRQEEARGGRRDERDERDGFEGDDSGEYGEGSDFPAYDQPPQPFVRRDRPERQEIRQEQPRREQPSAPPAFQVEPEQGDEQSVSSEEDAPAAAYEPPENPFVRPTRGLRPRREDRRPRRDEPTDDQAASGVDPSVLPPAIAAGRADDEEAPPPRPRRTRRPKPPVDDAGEPLEAVG